MPYSNIDKPKNYFEATTYTGNGSTQSITSLNFSPDFVWLKKRNDVGSHNLFDSIRGATKWLLSNSTDAEGTTSTSLTSFDANGFSLGSNASTNSNTNTFISWSWRGSDSSAVSNTSGTITSTVSANTTSGFSIVTYTGTGATGTVGHGLGVTPKVIIIKNRSNIANWRVSFTILDGTFDFMTLNLADAKSDHTIASPTSSVFTVSTGAVTGDSANNYIAYIFAEVKGYSKFGSYTGNNNADGTFVYTGFRPRFVLIKRTDVADDWIIFDSVRNTSNVANLHLYPLLSNAETTGVSGLLDILSNGFKSRGNATIINASGTYIYMAFAENPFVSSKGIPCTAR